MANRNGDSDMRAWDKGFTQGMGCAIKYIENVDIANQVAMSSGIPLEDFEEVCITSDIPAIRKAFGV